MKRRSVYAARMLPLVTTNDGAFMRAPWLQQVAARRKCRVPEKAGKKRKPLP